MTELQLEQDEMELKQYQMYWNLNQSKRCWNQMQIWQKLALMHT